MAVYFLTYDDYVPLIDALKAGAALNKCRSTPGQHVVISHAASSCNIYPIMQGRCRTVCSLETFCRSQSPNWATWQLLSRTARITTKSAGSDAGACMLYALQDGTSDVQGYMHNN
jgi:hypothetical protein